MSSQAVLFSEMIPDPAWEGTFHAWYDTEHIPLRMAVPGFVGAQRYRAEGRPGYLAVYDMASEGVLASEAYQRVKSHPSALTARMLRDVTGFTRYIGTLTDAHCQPDLAPEAMLQADVLYAVMFNVPAERATEFDDWYRQDHLPLLLRASGWLGCRRFRISVADPEPFTHLAIHYLRDLAVLDSPERAAARATDWRARLAREAWFKGRYDLFHRHGARFEAAGAAALP